MSDMLSEDGDSPEHSGRISRPTLAQVNAVISFMEKHPHLADRRLRVGMGHAKFKTLWVELSNIANSIDGAIKSTKGWIKFWSDKKRSVLIKKKQIEAGTHEGSLTALEKKIYGLCDTKPSITTKKKKLVKEEPCNGDDNGLFDDEFSNDYSQIENGRLNYSESDERQLNIIDKLVVVMDQQSAALSQMAQATLNSSKALERIAEASHVQAVAVDRLASTFDTISSSFHDVRNAMLGIDYTIKRCYPATAPQQRQNSNIFS